MSNNPLKNVDTKEFELPETIYIHDIESRLFQSIVLQCLMEIDGIALIEGNIIDNLLGRDSADRLKGISVEQDQKTRSVRIRVEINIAYGVSIPSKAEQVQTVIAAKVSALTALHVACVHVVFKNLIPLKSADNKTQAADKPCCQAVGTYNDEL
jgi:uncharacterized alkaline shock family protein YloU